MPHFIFIQQISVLNILNMLYNLHFFSSKCLLFHNATLFGFCITHILNTGCAKIKKKIRRQKVKGDSLQWVRELWQNVLCVTRLYEMLNEAQLATCSMGTTVFPDLMRPGCEFNISPPSDDAVKNDRLRGQEKTLPFLLPFKSPVVTVLWTVFQGFMPRNFALRHIANLCVCCVSYIYYF